MGGGVESGQIRRSGLEPRVGDAWGSLRGHSGDALEFSLEALAARHIWSVLASCKLKTSSLRSLEPQMDVERIMLGILP